MPDRGRVLPFASAGGAKPIAATQTDAGYLAAAWGGVSGFRRTASIYPRRAKRRAQVCGDSTVKSDGRWAGSPHPPLTRSPFPYEGKALTQPKRSISLLVGRGISQLAASEALPLPDRGRVLAFTSAGGSKPNAGRGGLEGFTPPHRFKAWTAVSDGHCAFTRAARSAGLNFAVIPLSKEADVGRDHLIHREAVPLPLGGEDLPGSNVGVTYNVGHDCPLFTAHCPLLTFPIMD